MSMKLEGFDELERKLKQFQKKAEELEGTSHVTFAELFTPEFMSEFTDFSSLEEFMEKGGFVVNNAEDFKNIPDDEFDQHISKTTHFSSWEEMQKKAGEKYVIRQLGF